MIKNNKTVFVGVSPKEKVLLTGQAGGSKPLVFVGVSGGVDSSVSAALLMEQGYEVVGVFIRTWTPDFIECTWRDERRDAMRVCAHLGIPFLECDAEEEYKKGVADYMIEEYKKGNTPNPDVMCNREVKFGAFWNFAKSHGADYIATGHYASIKNNKNGFQLIKGIDSTKDQSYFLWTLTSDDLSHTLFPVGHLNKSDVRKLALKYKLPTAIKKDSQGVCFLGPLDMKEFLKHYIVPKIGNVLNEKGEIVGTHDGAVFFTLGERHGFTIKIKEDNEKPYYVISKNVTENTIVVSTSPLNNSSSKEDKSTITIANTNWISNILDKDKYDSQIRYHGEFIKCELRIIEEKNAVVIFGKDILVDKGQSIVVYDNEICIGGGVVL